MTTAVDFPLTEALDRAGVDKQIWSHIDTLAGTAAMAFAEGRDNPGKNHAKAMLSWFNFSATVHSVLKNDPHQDAHKHLTHLARIRSLQYALSTQELANTFEEALEEFRNELMNHLSIHKDNLGPIKPQIEDFVYAAMTSGFKVDTHCNPVVAYKGPRFEPTEFYTLEIPEQTAQDNEAPLVDVDVALELIKIGGVSYNMDQIRQIAEGLHTALDKLQDARVTKNIAKITSQMEKYREDGTTS